MMKLKLGHVVSLGMEKAKAFPASPGGVSDPESFTIEDQEVHISATAISNTAAECKK